MARLFFAVWPDARGAAALAALAGALATEAGGKPMPQGRIHLTLAFLGAISDSEREAAIDAANGIRGEPFEFSIDRTGSFRRARVAWAGIRQPSGTLLELQAMLAASLAGRGLRLDDRPYVPHVTLVRNAVRGIREASIAPIAWRVGAFTLVRSETGTGRYIVERDWKLGV